MQLSRKQKIWAGVVITVVAPLVLDMSGLQGFWPALAVFVGAVVWSLFLFRDEISRIRILADPRKARGAESPFWLILPGMAMLLMAFYPFVQLYVTAVGYVKPLTFDDLLQTYIRGRSLYVTDLARADPDSVVRGKVFEDVTFVGPAIITLEDSSMSYSSFGIAGEKIENIFLEIPPGTVLTGVIIFHNCTFLRCRFDRIQFTGGKVLFNKLKDGFMKASDK